MQQCHIFCGPWILSIDFIIICLYFIRWLTYNSFCCCFFLIKLNDSLVYYLFFWPRLPMIHLEKRLMHLSSILKTFCVHPHHTSSIPFMTPTEKEQIMFVDTLLVFVKVHQLQFLTVFGSTSQTMMLLHNLWSLLRGTLGIYMYYITQQYSYFEPST